MERKPAVVVRREGLEASEYTVRHHWRERSRVSVAPLSRLGGLTRAGVKRGRLAPGDSSYARHAHRSEEEWLFVLSGRGLVELEGRAVELGPGDFIAFPVPSEAHVLTNPFAEEVTYLMGGEDHPYAVVDYPERGATALLMTDDRGRLAFHELGPAQYPYERGT